MHSQLRLNTLKHLEVKLNIFQKGIRDNTYYILVDKLMVVGNLVQKRTLDL